MKTKIKSRLLFVLTAVFMALVFTLSACGDTNNNNNNSSNTPGEDGLVAVIVYKQPSKTEYYVGETFDPSGMVLKAKYEDETTVNLLYSDCTYNTEPLAKSDTEIRITYGSQYATIAISVSDVPEINDEDIVHVVGIELEQLPTNTVYTLGATFNPEGMKVKAVYSDGSTYPLSNSQLTYSEEKLTVSDTSVTVSYQGFHVDVPITVSKYSLMVPSSENKVFRMEAENADLSTYEFTATWALGKDKVETGSGASGGRYLGNLSAATGYLEYGVYSKVSEKVVVYLYCANGLDYDVALDDAFDLSWNGTTITSGQIIEHHYTQYSTFYKVLVAEVQLVEGENTMRFTFKGVCPNIDCVDFEVNGTIEGGSSGGSGSEGGDEGETKYDANITSAQTSYKVEAETCTVAGTPANGKSVFTEGAGNYLCCLGTIGNTVTVKIYSDAARTVSLTVSANHAYSGDWANLPFSTSFATTLNGSPITIDANIVSAGNWSTFSEVLLTNLSLQEGENVLVFTVKEAHVPNIDYFLFKTV